MGVGVFWTCEERGLSKASGCRHQYLSPMAFGPWREIAIGRDGAHLAMLPFAPIAHPFGIELLASDDERQHHPQEQCGPARLPAVLRAKPARQELST